LAEVDAAAALLAPAEVAGLVLAVVAPGVGVGEGEGGGLVTPAGPEEVAPVPAGPVVEAGALVAGPATPVVVTKALLPENEYENTLRHDASLVGLAPGVNKAD